MALGKKVQNADQGFIDLTCNFLLACQPEQIRTNPELCECTDRGLKSVGSGSQFLALCLTMLCCHALAVASLCRRLREQLSEAACPRKGILPMLAAIRALQPSSDFLTPMHADCFLL